MAKLSEIVVGWINYINKDPLIEKLAEDRFNVCLKCPQLKSNNKCRKCGCYMVAKTRSPKSKCPLDKWEN